MKTGIELIAEERDRQINKEGWTAEHDEQHYMGELSMAAALYASPNDNLMIVEKCECCDEYKKPVDPWPWWNANDLIGRGVITKSHAWDKRKKHDRIRRLTIAGALIAAEIDRIQDGGSYQ